MIDLQKRVGPLPLWAWLSAVGVGGILLYINLRKQSETTSSGSVLGSSLTYPGAGIDPTTGVPYSQELGLTGGGGGPAVDMSGLTQALSTIGTQQEGILNTLEQLPANIASGIPTPEPVDEQQALTDALGNIGAIVGLMGALAPVGGSARNAATGRGKGRRPVRRAKGRKRRPLRRGERPGAHQNERENVRAPNHSRPKPPSARFRARRPNTQAGPERSPHGGPSPRRPAPVRHRGPVTARPVTPPAPQRRRPQPVRVQPQPRRRGRR